MRRARVPVCRLILLLLLVCLGGTCTRWARAHTQLISPNGGESLAAGSIFIIDWIVEIEHQLVNWDLWYSVNSDEGPWIDIAVNLPPGDPTSGSQHLFQWMVPNNPSGQTWVRVRQDNVETDYFDVSDLPFAIVGTSTACDFGGDGLCDIADLNELLSQGPIAGGVNIVQGTNDQYDLDGDGLLNLSDLDQWLSLAAGENGFGSPYLRGDANLDGNVDGSDFVQWNAHKFSNTLRWDEGDFNGDGFSDGADFVVWNAVKFQSSDVDPVPEPLLFGLNAWLMVALIADHRRRSSR